MAYLLWNTRLLKILLATRVGRRPSPSLSGRVHLQLLLLLLHWRRVTSRSRVLWLFADLWGEEVAAAGVTRLARDVVIMLIIRLLTCQVAKVMSVLSRRWESRSRVLLGAIMAIEDQTTLLISCHIVCLVGGLSTAWMEILRSNRIMTLRSLLLTVLLHLVGSGSRIF